MKKIASLVLVLAFLCLAIPFTATADTSDAALYNDLLSGIKEVKDSIDISKYRISPEQLQAVMQEMHDNEPELFYCTFGCSYTYGAYVYNVLPKYGMEKSEIPAAKEYVNSCIDAIVATLPEGLDDAEKALYFHDYICLNFEYDTTYSIYDIYTMFQKSSAVCQGYTLLYDALLTRVGIENHAVYTSDHIWNQVKINNKWYHIDATWDDPIEDVFGRVCHDNFLQSDAALSADTRKAGYVAKYKSDDTLFDGLSWCNQRVPFAFAYGNIYCLDDNIISKMDIYTADHTYVYTVTDKWHSQYGTYVDCLSGFGSYQNKIIFNGETEIKYLDPADGTVGTVATPSLPANNYLYRMCVSGNKALYMYGTSYPPTSEICSVEIKFSAPAPECKHTSTYQKALDDGSTEIRCSSCDALIETIPAPAPHVHDNGYWCTLADGTKERRCTECGELLESIPPAATDPHVHDEGSWTTLADGTQERRCTECGELLESIPPSTETTIPGDVNADGEVDMFDYLVVKRIYFNTFDYTPEQYALADVNSDGEVDMFDYLMVKSIYFKG